MSHEDITAEIIHYQARLADLDGANERLREERDEFRKQRDLAIEITQTLTLALKESHATIDRLRIAISQGIEL